MLENEPNETPEMHDEPFLIGESPDTPIITPAPATKPSNSPQFTKMGCITAVILLVIGILICSGGNRWLFEPARFFGENWGDTFTSTLVSGGSQAALLLIIGFVMFMFRQEHLRLVRGIGAGLLVAAAYSVIDTVLIAWEAPLEYPGIPDLVPPGILIVVALVLLAIFGRRSLRSAMLPALTGLGLGLLVTSPWAFVGSLGEPLESLVALAEALAFGLWFGLSLSMVFYFDGDQKDRHLLWSSLIAAGFAAALLPTFLAGRGGYTMTAILLSPLLTSIPLAAMLTLWPNGLTQSNRWLPVSAFLMGYVVVPLLFFESIELEFMPEVSIKMAAGIFFVVLASLFIAAVWLIGRLIAGNETRRAMPAIILPLALIIIGTGIWLTDGGAWQQDTFFVVMANQADTSAALDIADRDTRVSSVYDQLVAHATADQADIRGVLDSKGATYQPFYLINAIEVQGGLRLRRQLARRDDVAHLLDSPQPRPIRNWFTSVTNVDMTTMTPTEPAPGDPVWGIEEVNAPQVWTEFDAKGEGIIVGSADSGVEFTHPALIDRYAGDVDNHDYTWFDPAIGNSSPADSGGHGTHTTGTIVGQFGIGVAPDAQWIACRNLPRNLGNPADYIACMEFLFAPFPIGGNAFTDGDPLRGAHLTNNSWGCPPEEGCDGETVGIGIRHLRHAGQMMVVSNGNSGPGCDTTGVPATNDDAFSVGALNVSGKSVVGFSSRGPAVDYDGDIIIKPDIIAPGVEIVSSLPGDTYGPSQGTSMAGPHVAGVVALLWSAAPELIGDIDQTEAILIETARQVDTTERCLDGIDTAEFNTSTGHGIVDAYAAVKAALGR